MNIARTAPIVAALPLIFAMCASGPAGEREAAQPASEAAANIETQQPNTPMTIGDGLFATFNTTKGKIVCQLEFEKTPMTVANFVGLAEGKVNNTAKGVGQPYFDGIVFHRVIPNFMIQGGDPTGTGMGGPGYMFPDEIVADLKHTGPGILSMANAGPGNPPGSGTNGSQFFITHVPTPWLDGKHTVFGHVVEGQDVANAIGQGDKIETLMITRKGKAAEAFDAAKVLANYKDKFKQR